MHVLDAYILRKERDHLWSTSVKMETEFSRSNCGREPFGPIILSSNTTSTRVVL